MGLHMGNGVKMAPIYCFWESRINAKLVQHELEVYLTALAWVTLEDFTATVTLNTHCGYLAGNMPPHHATPINTERTQLRIKYTGCYKLQLFIVYTKLSALIEVWLLNYRKEKCNILLPSYLTMLASN